MKLTQEYSQEIEPRLRKLAWIMLIAIGIILGRLYYLQGIRGNFYRLFSEENSIREMPIPALRGVLSDRNGEVLVDNRPAFDLVLIPQYVVDPKKVLETMSKNLNIPADLLQKQWEKRLHQAAYQPIPILKDVSIDIASWIKSHKNPWGSVRDDIDLRGVFIFLRYEREYADKDIASHLLGYMREIDAGKLKKFKKETPGRYRLGDAVGVSGLEEIYDLDLRGMDGYQQKVVNAVGREIVARGVEEELTEKQARHGYHFKLTLDAKLQKIARDYFVGKKGAAVALDPKTGAVLMLFSAPTFDLNLLGSEKGAQYWQEVATHPSQILLNRAIQGAYPPGSTYKIVVALAALQEGVIKPDQKFHCDGTFHFGNRDFHCWRKEGHGEVDFYRALVESCDVYFYNVGLKLGVDRLAKYAKAFGLGAPTQVGLLHERSGFIPTSEWKLKTRNEEWYEGETVSISIGQGYDSVTPMQSAMMIATIANGGKKIHPYMVESIEDPYTGDVIPLRREESPSQGDVVFSPEALELVRKGLVGVVAEQAGTAHHLSVLKIPMGGKTGTAQTVGLQSNCSGSECGDHAWFVAFAPADNPTIAVSVLVENGGHGSSAAAPLAGKIIEAYLKKVDLKNEKQTASKF